MIKNAIFFTVLSSNILILMITEVYAQPIYRIGVVPQYESRRIEEIWTPIITQISKDTGLKFELIGSASIPEFEKKIHAGKFDFAYMNPYHLIVANESQGYLPLIRDIKRKLFGIVVVRKNSSYQSVKDLDGKTIAFPAPNALGASLLPRAEFEKTYAININPRYVKSHSSVYLNVALGQVDAGGGVQKTFGQQPENIKDALRILYRTEKVPPHPLTYHPRISIKVVESVQRAFLELNGKPEGNSLLSKIPIKQAGITKLSDYSILKNMGIEKYYNRND